MAGRSSASHLTLVSRTQVECPDAGLHSSQGAQQIIAIIAGRHLVHKLLLSHNELGDDGCITLFDFLRSPRGRQHPISEIHLGSNKIGDSGLLAIGDYLKDNQHLHSLQLPHNNFSGDALTTVAFVHAINSSRLQTVNLASNGNLSDAFAEIFLPSLKCSTLRHLNLTAMRLTANSVPSIAAYLSSNQCCHLQSFSCNANQLGTPGVRSILDAIGRHNYRLTEVNLYSNRDDRDERFEEAQQVMPLLRMVLSRNVYLKGETEQEALRLLRYSRPLLLSSGSEDSDQKSPQNLASCNLGCSCFQTPNEVSSSRADPPFPKLPIEIKQHILSFFASTLSPAQRIRIYHYASLISTLPQLLPCLPSSSSHICGNAVVPDTSVRSGDGGKVWGFGGGIGTGGGCDAEKCMGVRNIVICQRQEETNKWLVAVGCDAYDPDGRT